MEKATEAQSDDELTRAAWFVKSVVQYIEMYSSGMWSEKISLGYV